jgi:hypothetical protein
MAGPANAPGLPDVLKAVAWINGTVAERECELIHVETLAPHLSTAVPLADIAAYVDFVYLHDEARQPSGSARPKE